MKTPFITLLFFAIAAGSSSQDCSKYAQFKQGCVITTTSYNEKDKVQGFSKSKCLSVAANGAGITANMRSESFDKNGKDQSSTDFTMTCRNGIVLFDIKMMIPSQSTSQYENMEMKIEGDNLEFPSSLSAGQKLKDGKATITFTSPGSPVNISMQVNITNLKVEAKEALTTPAGTYECYKITYDIETLTNVMGMNMSVKGKEIQWYNMEINAVKTQNYDKDGKMLGYSLVTEIKK